MKRLTLLAIAAGVAFTACTTANKGEMEVLAPGQCATFPNGVVVVTAEQSPKLSAIVDGVPCEMKQIAENTYGAELSQYSKTVKVVLSKGLKKVAEEVDLTKALDVQGHRGGAGLMPENTIASMKNALDLGVNTLEMDFQLSQDGQVVVSHENFFKPAYCLKPDGSEIAPDEKIYIYTLPYSEICKYDTGSKVDPSFPDKVLMPACKPLATDLIDFCESYAAEHGMTAPRYNIEVKSSAKEGEGVNWPDYKTLSDAIIGLLKEKNIGDRLVIQCFDTRALNYIHETYPEIVTSYLTDAKQTDYDELMSLINYKPEWLSPNYKALSEEFVQRCKEDGVRLVPWTVDDPEAMQKVIDLGVEALITNYPDRLLAITRK